MYHKTLCVTFITHSFQIEHRLNSISQIITLYVIQIKMFYVVEHLFTIENSNASFKNINIVNQYMLLIFKENEPFVDALL